jgi:purine-binding chemotaxis protein CheW
MAEITDEPLKVILFKLKDETYGVSISQVVSIERPQSITRVPHTADFVVGVMNLRGKIVPVVDVRKRLRMESVAKTGDERVMIVDTGDVRVGLLVDSANEVTDIDQTKIDRTPDIVGGPEARYISGVAQIADDRLLILLNLEQVLSEEEVATIRQLKV